MTWSDVDNLQIQSLHKITTNHHEVLCYTEVHHIEFRLNLYIYFIWGGGFRGTPKSRLSPKSMSTTLKGGCSVGGAATSAGAAPGAGCSWMLSHLMSKCTTLASCKSCGGAKPVAILGAHGLRHLLASSRSGSQTRGS